MTIGVVMNPAAGGGRLRQDWPQLRRELHAALGAFELRETRAPGEAALFAHAFAAAGCSLVVAIGGDGTFGDVADGLLRANAEGAALPQLGLVPCGSASDFARSIGMPHNAFDAVDRLASGSTRAIDAGRLTFVDFHGREAVRHFLNIASVGLSAPIAKKVNEDRRKHHMSATALFYWRTASELLRCRFHPVRITVDDAPPIEIRIALAAACNGGHFGGGMMIAPDAAAGDGLLDFVVLRCASRLRLLWDMRLVYGGRHRNHPAIDIMRGRRFVVEPLDADGPLVEADGECLGRVPAVFEVMPGVLTLRC